MTSNPVDDAALPIRQVRAIRIGAAKVLATRLSYAGELGWELTVAPAEAVAVWDALLGAGAVHGIEPIGYRALDSLRLEKGYRYFGAELTPRETPFEAGLERFVRLGKGDFVGRDALVARRAAEPNGPARRLRTLLLGGDDWAPIYGGEAVRIGGEVVGRLRSAAFGYTVGRTVGTTYLPAGVPEGAADRGRRLRGSVAARSPPTSSSTRPARPMRGLDADGSGGLAGEAVAAADDLLEREPRRCARPTSAESQLDDPAVKIGADRLPRAGLRSTARYPTSSSNAELQRLVEVAPLHAGEIRSTRMVRLTIQA